MVSAGHQLLLCECLLNKWMEEWQMALPVTLHKQKTCLGEKMNHSTVRLSKLDLKVLLL